LVPVAQARLMCAERPLSQERLSPRLRRLAGCLRRRLFGPGPPRRGGAVRTGEIAHRCLPRPGQRARGPPQI